MSSVSPATIANKMVAVSQDESGVRSIAVGSLSQEQLDALAGLKAVLLEAAVPMEDALSGDVSLLSIVSE